MRIPSTCPLPPGSIVWGCLRDSGGDGQERSVEQQRTLLHAYCQQHQLVLENLFEDVARPGDSAENRDALRAMLAEIRERFPQVHDRHKRGQVARTLRRGIVFWNFARLGRDRLETTYIRNDLRMRGLVIISLSDDILTGNELIDPILEQLIDYQNEQFLDTLSKDVKRGLHSIVSMRDTYPSFVQLNPDWQPTGHYLGIFPGRIAPRGFRFEKVAVGMRRDGRIRVVQRLVPDPEAWDRCLLAWRMRILDQAPYVAIHAATHLYARPNFFSTMFKNRIYTGVFEFGDQVYGTPEDPYVPVLIPAEWYEIEKERRAKRALRRQKGGHAQPDIVDARSHRQGRLLSGLLICARCGSRLHVDKVSPGVISTTGQVRKEWPFYWCSEAKRGHCDAGRINARRLEESIMQRFERDVLTPEQLRKHANRLIQDMATRQRILQEEVEALAAALAATNRQTSHLADVLAERPTSPTLLQRLDEAEAKQQALRRDIQLKQAELAYWSAFELNDAELERLQVRIVEALASGDRVKTRLALSSFILHITVDSGSRISARIQYTFPRPDEDGNLLSRPMPTIVHDEQIRRRPPK